MHLLDSTSGNMGIAYATFGSALGIPVTLALPSNASPERIKILEALGANLILTDPLEGSDGAIQAAKQHSPLTPFRRQLGLNTSPVDRCRPASQLHALGQQRCRRR